MKIFYILLIVPIAAILSCVQSETKTTKSEQTINFYKATESFIEFAIKNDTSNLHKILAEDIFGKDHFISLNFDISIFNNYINKYGLPQKSSWLVQYDTVQRLTKFVHIIVPIFDGYDKKSRLKKAYLKLTFDYTGHFLPSNRIVDYDLVKEFKP
jgi:hypothetical protein